MAVTELPEQQELLTTIVLNRAILGECDGSNPDFLEPGQTLWAWFGFESEQEVHDYQAKLLQILPGQPRVKRALSEKDWYIVWEDGKYYLTYKKGFPATMIASFTKGLIALATKKAARWLVAGIVVGMVVVYSILNPQSLLILKLFIFAFSSCFYALVAFLGGMFLFNKLTGSLDKDNSSWTRTQKCLFFAVLLAALTIGGSMGVWAAGEVSPDDNPWREEVDQTYPY